MSYSIFFSLVVAIIAANPEALYLSVLTVFLMGWITMYGFMIAFGSMAILLLKNEVDHGWLERKVLSVFTLPPFSLSLILCLKALDLANGELLSLAISALFVLAHAYAATAFFELQFELLRRRSAR